MSNLPFLSKVLEKVVAYQLRKDLEEHHLQEHFQSAYKMFYSTETDLLQIQNEILSVMGKQEVLILVLFDLSAAFHTINQRLFSVRLLYQSPISVGILSLGNLNLRIGTCIGFVWKG